MQDRAHLTQVLRGHCDATQAAVRHYFEESPFRSVWPTAPVQLKTARATTASSAVCVQLDIARRQRLGPYAYSYRTEEAQLISQTATREERLAVERLQCIPFFITSSYNTCICHIHHLAYRTYSHFPPDPFFVITHQ